MTLQGELGKEERDGREEEVHLATKMTKQSVYCIYVALSSYYQCFSETPKIFAQGCSKAANITSFLFADLFSTEEWEIEEDDIGIYQNLVDRCKIWNALYQNRKDCILVADWPTIQEIVMDDCSYHRVPNLTEVLKLEPYQVLVRSSNNHFSIPEYTKFLDPPNITTIEKYKL